MGEESRLVYSTDKEILVQEETDRKDLPVRKSPSPQGVKVRLDRKGRGGKSVTVIEGLRLPQREKEQFLRQVKTRFGTGGTVRDDALEIQGDYCDALMTVLEQRGYRPKRSGG